MTKAQQVYREVRKYLNKDDARTFTIGIIAKPELLDMR
jgi:hypothetical protein